MSKKEDKTNLEKTRLEQKKLDQIKKIDNRWKSVEVITARNPESHELKAVNKKFNESYQKKRVFAEELLKSRQNCAELKSKINKFVKQQNMLMIKLKSSMGKGGAD
jgi:hypothetical protein